METTTLTINVPKNVGAILEEKAKTDGKELVEYVEDLVAKPAARRSASFSFYHFRNRPQTACKK